MLPDIPTVAEFVPGYEASLWNGFGASGSTPVEIVEKLNKEINAGGQFIAEETEKWGKVIRAASIKPE